MRNVEDRGVAMGLVGLVCRFGRGEGEHAALDGLDLEVRRGEVTAVVGPSGAGKSTLLRVIAGLVAPDAGDVRFDGASVLALPPEKRRLGVVFQSYALFPHLTVADNVAFPLRVRGVGRRAARSRIGEVLERLEIGGLADRHPHQLSGGERQRVALARALASEPRALLLDEPLAALDARLRLALREELARRLRSAGLTALYVTHDQEEAMALGDRVAVLRAGRLEQVGTPETLYRSPATPFVATFFGEANFLPVSWDPAARRLSGPLGSWTVDEATARRFGTGNGIGNGTDRGIGSDDGHVAPAGTGRTPQPGAVAGAEEGRRAQAAGAATGTEEGGRPRTGEAAIGTEAGGRRRAATGVVTGAEEGRRARAAAGVPGWLMLRPESFRPAEDGPIRGRVVESTFLGGRRRLRVEVAGLPEPLKVDLPPVPAPGVGDLLPLEPDLATAALLPDAVLPDPGGRGEQRSKEHRATGHRNDEHRNARHGSDDHWNDEHRSDEHRSDEHPGDEHRTAGHRRDDDGRPSQ